MKITYTVEKVEKLDTVLRQRLCMSHRIVKETEKNILVNGKHRYRNELMETGDKVEINLVENILDGEKFINKYKCVEDENALNIIYEDEYILALNKPHNMPVHPSCNNYENTLSNLVAPYLARQNIYGIHIITRLDKDTSGVCIFAKHPYIQELFNIKKEELKFKKEYLCAVKGKTNKQGIIEAPILRKEGSIIEREVNEKGKYAKTEYFLKEYNKEKDYSILKVLLHTGRTHQIRVHMSYIGHTLLGDELYAKESEKQTIRNLIGRQALHCAKVSFIHPITKEQIEINA